MTMTSELRAELDALQAVLRVLEPLTEDGRHFVVSNAIEVLGIKIHLEGGADKIALVPSSEIAPKSDKEVEG